jgi:hypothetical protein
MTGIHGQLAEKPNGRGLREEEAQLIRLLLKGTWTQEKINSELLGSLVYDMQDGGMGSIRFAGRPGRKMRREMAEAQYTDVDGIDVLITVNLDEDDHLFELDIWKVDFSPLRRYPKSSDLILKDQN